MRRELTCSRAFRFHRFVFNRQFSRKSFGNSNLQGSGSSSDSTIRVCTDGRGKLRIILTLLVAWFAILKLLPTSRSRYKQNVPCLHPPFVSLLRAVIGFSNTYVSRSFQTLSLKDAEKQGFLEFVSDVLLSGIFFPLGWPSAGLLCRQNSFQRYVTGCWRGKLARRLA